MNVEDFFSLSVHRKHHAQRKCLRHIWYELWQTHFFPWLKSSHVRKLQASGPQRPNKKGLTGRQQLASFCASAENNKPFKHDDSPIRSRAKNKRNPDCSSNYVHRSQEFRYCVFFPLPCFSHCHCACSTPAPGRYYWNCKMDLAFRGSTPDAKGHILPLKCHD